MTGARPSEFPMGQMVTKMRPADLNDPAATDGGGWSSSRSRRCLPEYSAAGSSGVRSRRPSSLDLATMDGRRNHNRTEDATVTATVYSFGDPSESALDCPLPSPYPPIAPIVTAPTILTISRATSCLSYITATMATAATITQMPTAP